jgi:hypothetical protein
MAKRLMILIGTLIVVLVTAAVPVLAQEEGTTQGGSTDIPPGPPPDTTATLSFELTVKGDPPAGTTFLGFMPAEGGISVPLTDPDGDGVYTGSTSLDRFGPGPRPVPPGTEPVSLPVQIAQENGGNLEVIRDFGVAPLDGDKTFKAKVSFKEDRGGATTPDDTTTPDLGNGDSNDGNSGSDGSGSGVPPASSGSGSGSSGDGVKSGKSSSGPGGIKVLPNTGGADLTTLGAGVLLIASGLLIRKIFR